MPRLILSAELSSADQTRLDAALGFALTLSGELTDTPDLYGDLTTGIEMSASLPMSLTLAADLNSADLAASLPMSLAVSASITTAITMQASLPMSLILAGFLKHTPSGDLDSVARPGQAHSATVAASANGSLPTASANGTAPRMVES